MMYLKHKLTLCSTVLLISILSLPNLFAQENVNFQTVIDGFEKRVSDLFKADSGKPLKREKIKPPIKKRKAAYARGYSYSIVAFATRCYVLGEMLDKADAAIDENSKFYLDHPEVIHDRDSFHWHAEIVLRLIEMYGSKGSVHAGRMSPETETLALKPIWQYASKAWLAKAAADKKSIWHMYGSENHHAMDFTINWHFAKLAKDLPEYKNRKYEDGSIASQQYDAWTKYIITYCRERAKKSLCAEMRSDGYNSTLIKGFYNFYDFGDPQLKAAAGLFMDLYFTYWGEEQILGHMGGGASRIKGGNAFKQGRYSKNAALAWFYFAIGEKPDRFNGHDVAAMTSNYRPPALVAEIALDTKGRGTYEIRQRAQGLGRSGNSFPIATAKQEPTKLNPNKGGIIRYSYCTPSFIIGTPMVEAKPLNEWVRISSQNRWQGVIFAEEGDPRIVPIVRPKDNNVCYNSFWSVQSKGSLISQKLKTHKGAAEMMVFISKELGDPIIEKDMVFIESKKSYAVIRVPVGGFKWHDDKLEYKAATGGKRSTPPGKIMLLNKEYAPVILEVMTKTEVESMKAFIKKVKSNKPVIKNKVLEYQTIYDERMIFDLSYKTVPKVNGKEINFEPEKVYDSPFLESVYDSAVVTIKKANRYRILDFNKLTATDGTK